MKEIKDLIYWIKELRKLLSKNGDYIITRKNGQPFHFGDLMFVETILAQIDDAIRKIEDKNG